MLSVCVGSVCVVCVSELRDLNLGQISGKRERETEVREGVERDRVKRGRRERQRERKR